MMLADEYEETFKFGLMEVVFEWARGMVSPIFFCFLALMSLMEGAAIAQL